MFELKVIKEFKYRNFNNIKSIKRANKNQNEDGTLYVGDILTVETDEEMRYLCGENQLKFVACEVIVKEPEPAKEKKTTKKKGDK